MKASIAFDTPYAVPVHGDMTACHPVGGTKYLENAVKSERKAVLDIVAQELKKESKTKICGTFHAMHPFGDHTGVAQLDRAVASYASGHGFNSRHSLPKGPARRKPRAFRRKYVFPDILLPHRIE